MIDNTFTMISRIDGEVRRFIQEELEREGIKDIVPSHGAVVMELMAGEEIAMAELARRIGRTPQTVTCLVKKLVKEGYVKTARAAGDSRVTMAVLTDRGRKLSDILCAISEKIYEIQYEGISEEEISILRGALMRMHTNFAERGH